MRFVVKTILANIALVCVSVIGTLILAEVICRNIEPQETRNAFFGNVVTSLYRYDAQLGWSPIPNLNDEQLNWSPTSSLSDDQRKEVGKTSVHINSDGMRYHEVGPKKRFRVAVIGDSFAWGLYVNAEDRFSDMIESRLPVDMLNFGVSSYGPPQYYMELDKVLGFKPDLVIVVFCLGNDFTDTIRNFYLKYYKPYAALENGRAVIKGVPVYDINKFGDKLSPFLAKSALARLVYKVTYDYAPQWTNYFKAADAPDKIQMVDIRDSFLYKNPDSPQVDKIFTITQAVMLSIKEKLAAQGVPLIILQARTNYDLKNDTASELLKKLAADIQRAFGRCTG